MLFYFSHFGCGAGQTVTVDVFHLVRFFFPCVLARSHSGLCRLIAVTVCKSSLTAVIYVSHCWSRPGDWLIWLLCCWWLCMDPDTVPVIWWVESMGSLFQQGYTNTSSCQYWSFIENELWPSPSLTWLVSSIISTVSRYVLSLLLGTALFYKSLHFAVISCKFSD